MTEHPNIFTVYYDGSCPLCIKEISFYRRLKDADKIHWEDVSTGSLSLEDLSCDKAMARFHVRDKDGTLIDGGRAFIALWKELPAFRLLGTVCSIPIIRWSVDKAYNIFLPIRPHLQRFAQKR